MERAMAKKLSRPAAFFHKERKVFAVEVGTT